MGQDRVGPYAVRRVGDGQMFGQGDDGRLRGLVADCGVVDRRRDGGDVQDRSEPLLTHHRQGVLAGQHHAPEVDLHDVGESLGGDLGDRGVSAGLADSDVVVEDVDPTPRVDTGRTMLTRSGSRLTSAATADAVRPRT